MSSENPRHWNYWKESYEDFKARIANMPPEDPRGRHHGTVLAWQAKHYLGPNLAAAGALCKAFWDGYGLAEQDLHGVCPQKTWEPGCNL